MNDNVKPFRGSLSVRGWQSTRGENNKTAKLNDAQVRRILESRRTSEKLAEHHGVSVKTINDIRSGRRWRHLHIEHVKNREAQS